MAGETVGELVDIEQRVLRIVSQLLSELGGPASRDVAPDESLERDLGLSSLERVELFSRLERAFGVHLPDSAMSDAVSARDLVHAIARAAPAVARAEGGPTAGPLGATMVPVRAGTLVDVLRFHAEHAPERPHIRLRVDDDTESTITYGTLLARATSVAAGLAASGVGSGETVALMLRTERAYFEAFFGALLAGAIPVPLYPPVRRDDIAVYARRQRGILENAGARALVVFPDVEPVAGMLRAQVPTLASVTTVERLAAAGERASTAAARASTRPDDLALIQYTSGSTGFPKGVPLSHANILANIRALGKAIAVRSDDVTVSWLPLYHDMGLIGAWLGSLYFGVPLVLMSPLTFLSRPARWLRTIEAHRATISPAPNFAFDLCVHKIPDEELVGLDLRSWRLAFNGSEVVGPDTIDRFVRRFAPYGFRSEAMCPVYGLAESTVGLTVPPLERPARVDRLAREPFERSRAVRAAEAEDTHPLRFVSCGAPLPGHAVRVVDDDGRPAGERVEGHVQFRGPSVTRGYYHNPAATRAVLRDGWMDSGDLGYLADGELFITGREKDLIVVAGRNVSAQEVEDAAAVVPGIRRGCVAAFGVHDARRGTERLVVVAETRERASDTREALRRAVLDAALREVGLPPDQVVITGPGAVRKTSSGKIRRGATRDAFVAGALEPPQRRTPPWMTIVLAAAAGWGRRGGDWAVRVVFTLWVWIVVGVTLPLLWLRLLVMRPSRRAHRAATAWSRGALKACGIRLRVSGREHLVGLDAGILVANHASYIDPIVLMAALPLDFRFIAKGALVTYPVLGTVIDRAQHVTIEKADVSERLAGAENLSALLRQHDLLAIFPEGTFVRAPGLLPFRLGAFKAAVETRHPVVPVAIRGTRRIFPAETPLFRPGTVEITIGAPLEPRDEGWPEMVRLRDAAREVIGRGCGE